MSRSRRPLRRAGTEQGTPTLIVPTATWPTRGNCAVPPDASTTHAAAVWDAFDEPTAGLTDAARAQRLATVRAICSTCPVLLPCRELGQTQRFGFYGGLTPEERAARRRGDRRTHEQLMRAARRVERQLERQRAHRTTTTNEGIRA